MQSNFNNTKLIMSEKDGRGHIMESFVDNGVNVTNLLVSNFAPASDIDDLDSCPIVDEREFADITQPMMVL